MYMEIQNSISLSGYFNPNLIFPPLWTLTSLELGSPPLVGLDLLLQFLFPDQLPVQTLPLPQCIMGPLLDK